MTGENERRVLIAGAGPAGCVAALILARAGIPVTLLEAEQTLPTDLRASTFHPPTLDMMHELGLADHLVENGLIAGTYQYRDRQSDEAVTFDMSCLAGMTKFPFRLQCEQFKLTRAAVAALGDEPTADMRYGCAARAVEQDGDGVRLQFDGPSGRETLAGAFLIGADGASSAIRDSLAIPFPGFTYPEQWVVVSTPDDFAEHFEDLSPVCYTADPKEWYVLLRTVDLWRVLIPVPNDADPELVMSDSFVQEKLQGIARRPRDYRVEHRTIYRVHQRVAQTYHAGRVALAGDAAHINNPLGGMGMNGGIHDAVTLAKKLVRILVHGADPGRMLDHYTAQRRAIAEEYVQAHTHQNKQQIEETDADKRRAHLEHLRSVVADREALTAFVRRGAMIDAVEKSMFVDPQ